MKGLLAAFAAAAVLAAPATASANEISGSQTVGWAGFGSAIGGPVAVGAGAVLAVGGSLFLVTTSG